MIRIATNNFKIIEFPEKYCYEEELRNGIIEAFEINNFQREKLSKSLKYINQFVDRNIIIKLITKELLPFKDKKEADNILETFIIKQYPEIKSVINQIDIIKFAGDYIEKILQNKIIKAYNQIQEYSNNIFEELI